MKNTTKNVIFFAVGFLAGSATSILAIRFALDKLKEEEKNENSETEEPNESPRFEPAPSTEEDPYDPIGLYFMTLQNRPVDNVVESYGNFVFDNFSTTLSSTDSDTELIDASEFDDSDDSLTLYYNINEDREFENITDECGEEVDSDVYSIVIGAINIHTLFNDIDNDIDDFIYIRNRTIGKDIRIIKRVMKEYADE